MSFFPPLFSSPFVGVGCRRRSRVCFPLGKWRRRLPTATPLFGWAGISMSPRAPVGKEMHPSSELGKNCGARSARSPSRNAGSGGPSDTAAILLLCPFLLTCISLRRPFHHFQTQASFTRRLRRPGASESSPDTSGSVTR